MSSTLIVDLKKLDSNLNAVNDQLKNNVQRMAVIKDNAYGHGLLRVAHHLKEKVEWFCVARVDEAVKLREDGITKPILVFEVPPFGEESKYVRYNLTASISDLSVFERLEAGTDCHLKFDTGMGRVGMLPSEASLALDYIKKYDKLNITGIFTHFANADALNHPHVWQQLETFKLIRAQFPAHLMTHAANSGAIFYYKDADLQFDAVRPGVCLFGYSPGKTDVPQLHAIAEWRTTLVQVKSVKKGDTVGYGSRWQAPSSGYLGLLPVGYADGVSRSLSGKIKVGIAGKLYPQVGTISMDYSAVYLGDDQLKAGEEVTLLKEGVLPVAEWARLLDTIPYEVITCINGDERRVYIE